MITRFLAIDPGNKHQGVAKFEIDVSYNQETQQGEPTLWRKWTQDLSRNDLYELIDDTSYDAMVVEEYRLYPELAREQGYSSFETVEVIGVLKYVADLKNLPIYMQGASIKRASRRIGETLGFPGKVRMLGSATSRYRGWDFDGPSQHERDATAHGVWWAFKHRDSMIKGTHEKGCKLCQSE